MTRLQQHRIADFRLAHMPNTCPILGIPLDPADAVLDHDHRSGHVRGVIHRQANALLGKIENFHQTFLSRLGCEDLRPVLIAMVDWMECDYSQNAIHPNGIKTQVSRFRSRNAAEQKAFLQMVGIIPASNAKGRINQFRKWILKTPVWTGKPQQN